MKKLRLDPDTLRIESFAPTWPEKGEGTIVAGSFGPTVMTCRESCVSCNGTCATCYNTCDNLTCHYTCPYSCEPLICG